MLFNDRGLVAEFFGGQLDMPDSEDLRGAIYVHEKFRDRIMTVGSVGVAIAYNNFNGRTCAIHIVIQDKTVFNRQIIREAFEYPFIQCGLTAIITSVDSKNVDSLELARRVGFREVHTVKDGGVDGDMIIFEMRHDECRWLKRSA